MNNFEFFLPTTVYPIPEVIPVDYFFFLVAKKAVKVLTFALIKLYYFGL